jgi:hypothetical protein
MKPTLLHLVLASLCFPAAGIAQEFDVPWYGYDASHYPQGVDSWGSRMADLSGDGVPDMAVSGWYANPRFSVIIADGSGGFAQPVLYTILLGARDLETGDFDKDGDVDLVVADTGQYHEGTTFGLFLNQGSGSFVGAGSFACGKGPNGFAKADFNGDGRLDVAVAHADYIYYGASIAVVLASPGGGFQSPVIYGLQSGTYKVAAGDMDGDSDVDLVVGYETNRISVLLNAGNGSFFAPVHYAGGVTSSIFGPGAVELGDVDKDGDLDVLYSGAGMGNGVQGNYGTILFYRNNGNGSLAAPVAIPLLLGGDGAVDIRVADVTGDGTPDILGALFYTQRWALLTGTGGGSFGPAQGFAACETPMTVDAGDADGDGDLDVVVLGRDSMSLASYENPGDGSFVQPPAVEMVNASNAPSSSSNLALGDVDGDGDDDFVEGFRYNFQGNLSFLGVRRNNGDGTFAPTEQYSVPYLPLDLVLGDLDFDGDLDALWLEDDYYPRFRYKLNNGDGTFGTTFASSSTFCDQGDLGLWDVNGDNWLDVVVGSCYAEVAVALNLKNGLFAPVLIHAVSQDPGTVSCGDLNGDGKLDLVTASGPQGYMEVSLGKGNGTFFPPNWFQSGRDVRAIEIADLDGDGLLDTASAYELDGNGVSVQIGRGDGSFKPTKLYQGSYSSNVDSVNDLLARDVDGDGDLDLLMPNYGSQDISLWRNRGDGTYDPHERLGVGYRPHSLVWSDLTGDGVVDLGVGVEISPPNTWYYPGVVILEGTGAGGPQIYCTAKLNSLGCAPSIGWSGTPSASAGSGFVVTAKQVLNQKFGLLFYSTTGAASVAFQGGTLCTQSPIRRTTVQSAGGSPLPQADCSGTYALDFNAYVATGQDPNLVAGATVWAQYWSRDPGFAPPQNTGLSNAVEFVLAP